MFIDWNNCCLFNLQNYVNCLNLLLTIYVSLYIIKKSGEEKMWLSKEKNSEEKRNRLLALARATGNWHHEFEFADPEEQREEYGYEKLDDDLISIAKTQLSLVNVALKHNEKRFESIKKKMIALSLKAMKNPKYQPEYDKSIRQYKRAHAIKSDGEEKTLNIIRILGSDLTMALVHDFMTPKPYLKPYIELVKAEENPTPQVTTKTKDLK